MSCRTLALIVLLLLTLWTPAGAKDNRAERKNLYVLKNYSFLPAGKTAHEGLGASLCGTRCSSLAMDYLTFTTPPGYYLQKIADNKTITVDLDNPYLKGQCACEVDEYVLKINDLYMVTPKYPENKGKGQ